MSFGPLPVGERKRWRDLPRGIRSRIEDRFDSPIVEEESQPTGFSPAVATRVLLADGRRAFIKVVGPEPNADSPDIHRREARIASAMPAEVPMPPLLWHLDEEGWVTLAFEDVEGRLPAIPWRPDELDRVLATMRSLSQDLTPSPIEAPSVAEAFGDWFVGWRSFAQGVGELQDSWAANSLDRLVELETRWTAASAGTTLLHIDLRA
jgi:hypothetical protein